MDDTDVYKKLVRGPFRTVAGKPVCDSCGLVILNNKITEWCIDKGPMYDLASGCKGAIRRLTKSGR